MKIELNADHLAALVRFSVLWGVYVAIAVIGGLHLKPLLDEVVFVALLPLPFIAAYAVWCFIVAVLRVYWITRSSRAVWRVLSGGPGLLSGRRGPPARR